ncbi:MAG: hypothetical protein ABI670_08080 [Chloroflexota bacterium]
MKTQVLLREEEAPLLAAEQPAPAPRRNTARSHLLVILAYSLLTVVMTWPVAVKLTTDVPGGGDAWQNIWNLWWVKEALLNLHTNPYHTDLLHYPYGANLYFHTLVLSAGIIGIPLQLVGLNLITTYNLILLSSFVLAGYGAYLLCYYLTGNRYASFVGGLVFAFSPYHFAHMFGHMNLVSLQWMPFYVLVLLKAIDAPGIGREKGRSAFRLTNRRAAFLAVGAGALLALNAYTDWLYAIFLVMLTCVIFAWKLFVPSERRLLSASGVGIVEAGSRLALFGLAFLVLAAPIFFPTLGEAGQGYAQQPPEETLFYSSDLISAFLPNELHPLWGDAIKARVNAMPPYLPLKNSSERVLFLGYVVLALAAFGAWRLRANRHVRFWGFTAVLMWILSLGPVLQVMGKSEFTLFKVSLPLPYLLLYKVPFFSIMRTPARLTVLVMLALAIVVAFTLATLLPRVLRLREGLPQRTRVMQYGAAVAIPLLILFEFLSAPFPMVPPGWNIPIYARIAQEPGRFALLELPIRPFGDYMAYQTIHGKPIIGGYLSRQPPYPLLEQNAAVKYLLDTTPVDDPSREAVKDGQGVQSLKDLNVKYVIIRWWAFTPEQRAAMEAKLSVLLGRAPDFTYPGDQVDVWQLLP